MIALHRDRIWLATAIFAVAVLLFFLVWPLVTMFGKSLADGTGGYSLAGYARFFGTPAYRDVLFNTLILGAAVTVASVAVGGGLALLVARCDFPLKIVVTALPLVTLVIPDVVVAAAWMLILGRQGIVNTWLEPLGVELPSIFSWWGLVFVMTLNNYVYAFVTILVGLKGVDRHLEEAATSLGRPMSSVFVGVTFPLILPSIFAGALVVFTHVIGSFGVPAILGAKIPVLAVKAYNEFVSEMGGNPLMQTTMSSLLVFLGVGMLLLQKLVVERRQFQMEAHRAPPAVRVRGAAAVLGAATVTAVLLLSIAPAIVALVTAVTPAKGPVLRYGGFTLAHLEWALKQAPEPMYNSLFLASIATVTGVVFSVAAAYLIVKRRSLLTQGLDVLVMLPLTIAGTVLGIALINTFNTGWLVLTGSWVIMALAYFLRRVPTSVRAAVGPLHNLKDSIEEASIGLGVPPGRTFFKVALPLLLPAVAAAAVLMWITTLSELSATIVLYFGGMNTMPIEIFQQVDSGRLALASAYSVLLLLAIFVPLAIARFAFGLRVGTVD